MYGLKWCNLVLVIFNLITQVTFDLDNNKMVDSKTCCIMQTFETSWMPGAIQTLMTENISNVLFT